MVKMTVIMLVCLSSAVRADGPVDASSVTAMLEKQQEQMEEHFAKLEEKIVALLAKVSSPCTARCLRPSLSLFRERLWRLVCVCANPPAPAQACREDPIRVRPCCLHLLN